MGTSKSKATLRFERRRAAPETSHQRHRLSLIRSHISRPGSRWQSTRSGHYRFQCRCAYSSAYPLGRRAFQHLCPMNPAPVNGYAQNSTPTISHNLFNTPTTSNIFAPPAQSNNLISSMNSMAVPRVANNSNSMNGFDFLGGAVQSPMQQPAVSPIASQTKQYTIDDLAKDASKRATIFNDSGVKVTACPCQDQICLFRVMNTSSEPVTDFQLSIAVTPTVQVSIQDPDKTSLPALDEDSGIIPSLNQIVTFVTQSRQIVVKFRLKFNHNASPKDVIDTCSLTLN